VSDSILMVVMRNNDNDLVLIVLTMIFKTVIYGRVTLIWQYDDVK